MKKKAYMQPALEIMLADPEQLVAVSVTSVQTDGLDDEGLNVDDDNKDGDPWEFAW